MIKYPLGVPSDIWDLLKELNQSNDKNLNQAVVDAIAARVLAEHDELRNDDVLLLESRLIHRSPSNYIGSDAVDDLLESLSADDAIDDQHVANVRDRLRPSSMNRGEPSNDGRPA